MYWNAQEDAVVVNHVSVHGEGHWNIVGGMLERSANSCYLRWKDHLKPGLEHGDLTIEEKITIIRLHKQYSGNQWAKIAKKLSETSHLKRSPNKIKNFWYGPVKKKALELNLEVDTDMFVTTMTQIILRREIILIPEFVNMDHDGAVSWDHLSNGAAYTLDDIPNMMTL